MTAFTQEYNTIELTSSVIEKAKSSEVYSDFAMDLLDQWSAEMSKIQNIMGMHDYFGGF